MAERTTVAEHRATRSIEGAVANPAWINASLRQCQMDVQAAQAVAELGNHKAALTTAYDAVRAAVECHMNASKLRIANQQGAHKVAIDYAAEKMSGLIDGEQVEQYDQLRILRHSAEYAFSSSTRAPIRAADAQTAIILADSVVTAVIGWWAATSKPGRRG
jgi:hypothetical protein